MVKLKLISKKNAKILGSLAKDVINETANLKKQFLQQSYNSIPKQLKPSKPQTD